MLSLLVMAKDAAPNSPIQDGPEKHGEGKCSHWAGFWEVPLVIDCVRTEKRDKVRISIDSWGLELIKQGNLEDRLRRFQEKTRGCTYKGAQAASSCPDSCAQIRLSHCDTWCLEDTCCQAVLLWGFGSSLGINGQQSRHDLGRGSGPLGVRIWVTSPSRTTELPAQQEGHSECVVE